MNLGIIVGRFQVPELHEGHIKLINHVKTQFDQVLIVLGVSPVLSSSRNPLNFITREKMIHESYPEITVAALMDKHNDEEWSKQLDLLIQIHNPSGGKVTLFGGRDSFIPYYTGRHKTVEIEVGHFWTGTQMREQASNQIIGSKDFRHGVIYGLSNQYEKVFQTVDIAIVNSSNQVLLGKRVGEQGYRFPGGFVSQQDYSLEAAAKREAEEETGLELNEVEYVGSIQVKDWRYNQPEDGLVMTSLFVCKDYSGRRTQGADDLDEVKWFNPENITPEILVKEHWPLFQMLKDKMPLRSKLVGWTDKGV